MSTSTPRFAVLLILVAAAAAAQTPRPVFSPTSEGRRPPAQPGVAQKGASEAESVPVEPTVEEREAGLRALFERLRRWPTRPAREAALTLAGVGSPVRERLLAALKDPDWRIQSGAAFALAEMGTAEAIPAIQKALADPSNRAAFPHLLPALIKLDPVNGPGTVFPFLSHVSGKVRAAARRAMPPVLDPRFLPRVLEQIRSRRGSFRRTGLELLSRIPGSERSEEFFAALADPDQSVASFASQHLGARGTPRVRERLLELARTAPLRRATYGVLALVEDEDRSGESLVPVKGAIYKRALGAIASKDPFYRGAAAILMANLSYRSDDADLRQMADRFLVPILLNTVAGGVFFSDYNSLEQLCWKKLEMLTGQSFGPNAPRWWKWWERHQDNFAAQRELRSITEEQLAESDLLVVREMPDARLIQIRLTGRQAVLGDPDPKAPLVLGQRERRTLARLVASCEFFKSRGEPREAGRVEGFYEFTLRCGNTQYRRFHHGKLPDTLAPLYEFIDTVRRELAWQRFAPAGATAESRRDFLAQQQSYFQAETDASKRRARICELAAAAYPGLPRVTRNLAVAVLAEADSSWIGQNRPALLACLNAEERLTDEAATLTRILARDATTEVRDAVVRIVSVGGGSAKADFLLREFLEAQPLQGVLPLMTSTRARVRALAAESLARFKSDPSVADVLIGGLKDYEPRVRDACVTSLARLGDKRVLALLENILAGDDRTLRARAILAMGAVGGDDIVPRLMEIYRDGDKGDRWAVIAALKQAGGQRAVVQLSGIIRATGPLELRKEALDSLVSIRGNAEVAARLREVLESSRDLEIRVLAVGGLARVLGPASAEFIRPFANSDEAPLRRIALITLARLGDREALKPLVPYLEALEGDLAAERALERLTFFKAYRPAPSMRVEEWKNWVRQFGALSRSEWFLLAAKKAQVELDPRVLWLEEKDLSWPSRLALLRVVERGSPGARYAAEETLIRVARRSEEPLPLAAGNAEIKERVEALRQWLAGRGG